jgi:hypothetical protein
VTRSPLQLALSARKPPLWARWLLTILGFAVLGVAAVIAVHSINDSALPAERSAVLEADRESQAAIEADQAPHSSPLPSATRTRAALQRAIATDMHNRIRHGQLPGPLQGVRCTPAGAHHPQGQAFHCTARAAAITYPFLGAVDEHARQLTWCKVDPAPVHDGPQEIPVNPRCRA